MRCQKVISEEQTLTVIWDKRDGLPDMEIECHRNWPTSIYLIQKMDKEKYGYPFPAIRSFDRTLKMDSAKLMFLITTLLSSVKELWILTDEITPLKHSEWHGWILTFVAKQYFTYISVRRDRRNPFKTKYASKVSDVAKKLIELEDGDDVRVRTIDDLEEIFDRHSKVECFDSLVIHTIDDTTEVLIINGSDIGSTAENGILEDTIVRDGKEFELRVAITMAQYNERGVAKWQCIAYRRHGGTYKNWWKQSKVDNIPIQIGIEYFEALNMDELQCLLYVVVHKPDVIKMRNDFMTYMGGQSHIQCSYHKLPLVISNNKNKLCRCGKKEYISCPSLNCEVNVCKRCMEEKDRSELTYIDVPDQDDMVNLSNEESSDDESEEESHYSSDEYSDLMSNASSYEEDEDMDLYNGVFDGTDPDYEELLIDPGPSEAFDESNEVLDELDIGIPSTDAGHLITGIQEQRGKGIWVSGRVIMNQCGSLLSRAKDKIRGSIGQKHFIQRLCSTVRGKSFPLAYPEAMSFPSIFWYMISETSAFPGAIPASLLHAETSLFGVASIHDHVRLRMTSCESTSYCDPRFISYSYDALVNLTCNKSDTRLILNRGLTVDTNAASGLGVRCKNDTSLFNSIDSKQMVKNLSASQKHHKMDFFLTFTCNQKSHFGLAPIKNWIDSDKWEEHYPNFVNLTDDERNQIRISINQSAGPIILRNWLETRELFVQWLMFSPKSPYLKNVEVMFARDE